MNSEIEESKFLNATGHELWMSTEKEEDSLSVKDLMTAIGVALDSQSQTPAEADASYRYSGIVIQLMIEVTDVVAIDGIY